MKPAPVALFAYKRDSHFFQAISALSKCSLAEESDLFIFCDGPRDSESLEGTERVRRLAHRVSGFKTVVVTERGENRGLSSSVISGVEEVLRSNDSVIVLEDDMVVSPGFLRYMNDGLVMYKEHSEVVSIHGYCYPTESALPAYFFLRGADCWGWATWRRGWEVFNPDGSALLSELRKTGQCYDFDFGGTFPFTRMLEEQVAGRNDSWAIRWYASAFLKKKLTLYPGKSLVQNIGLDSSGTHCGTSMAYDVDIVGECVELTAIPVKESARARVVFAEYFRRKSGLEVNDTSIVSRLSFLFRRIFKG